MRIFFTFLLLSVFSISFSQKKYDILNYPNSQDIYKSCEPITIVIKNNFTSSFVDLEYSTDGKKNWHDIKTFIRKIYPPLTDTIVWTPPQIESDSCYFRIGNTEIGYNEMKLPFKLGLYPSSYKIISPNGGEKFEPFSKVKVEWEVDTSSQHSDVRLSYSWNSGSDWSFEEVVPNNGSYEWQVSGNDGNTHLFKISDLENTCISDQSDSTFEVVYSPWIIINNISNFYAQESEMNIYLKGRDLTAYSADLYLSVDSGITWSLMDTSVAVEYSRRQKYSWNVPDTIISKNCYLKAIAVGDSGIERISERFEIGPPTVFVNIKENTTLYSCENFVMKFNTKGEFGQNPIFDFQISTNGGDSWEAFKTFDPQDSFWDYVITQSNNAFLFSPPKTNSNSCYIKIISRGDTSFTSISKKFSIRNRTSEFIHILTPEVNTSFGSGAQLNLKINSNNFNNKKASFSSNGGNTWNHLIDLNDSTNNVIFTLPNVISDSCLIAVSVNECITDTMDGFFSIFNESNISLDQTFSNSSQTYYSQNDYTFTWTTTNGSGFVNFDYSLDSGNTWLNAASNIEDKGVYSFKIPDTTSNGLTVRVSDSNYPEAKDIMDSIRTITKTWLSISYVKKTYYFEDEDTMFIEYDQGGTQLGKIYFSFDNGVSWETVPWESSDMVSYKYFKIKTPIVEQNSDSCLIRITDADSVFQDISRMFSIKRKIYLTSPQPNDYLSLNGKDTIKWLRSDLEVGASDDIDISISYDGGKNWELLYDFYSYDYYDDRYIVWGPKEKKSNNVLLSIATLNIGIYGIPIYSDTLKAPFSIIQGNPLSFNGVKRVHGINKVDTLAIYSNYLINPCVKIEITYNNGVSWEIIEENWALSHDSTGFSYYPWTVPDNSSSNCKIRISECGNASLSLKSETFQITEARYEITGIDEGDSLKGCIPKTIYYEALGYHDNATLYYSTDNKTSWLEMEGNHSVSDQKNVFDWTVPQIDANNAFIKVKSNTDSNDSTLFGPIILVNNPTSVELLEPTTGAVLTSTQKSFFKWEKSDNIKSKYSVNIKFLNKEGQELGVKNSYQNYEDSIYIEPDMDDLVDILLEDQLGCSRDTVKNISIINNPFIKPTIHDENLETKDNFIEINMNIESGNLPKGSNDKIYVSYSKGDENYWIQIGTVSDDYFTWNMPSELSFHTITLKFASYGTTDTIIVSEPLNLDVSSIEILSPGNPTHIYSCTTSQIKWKHNNTSNEKVLVNIYYSFDNGETWENPYYDSQWNKWSYTDSLNVTSWHHNFQDSFGSILLKIEEAKNPNVYDISKPFAHYRDWSAYIDTPYIVETPIHALDTVTIKWDFSKEVDLVELEWWDAKNNYDVTYPITVAPVPNTGEYRWVVPNTSTQFFRVLIKNAIGCTGNSTEDYEIIKDGINVSTSEIANQSKGYLFPNPSNGNTVLKGFSNIKSVRVFGASGVLIQTYKNNSTEISTENYSPGIYFIKINSNSGIETRRFIKLK